MTPQDRLEFEEMKRTVANLKAVTDLAFIENMKRRLDVQGIAERAAVVAIGNASINDLIDVDAAGATNGQVLKFTTTGDDRWIAGTDNT